MGNKLQVANWPVAALGYCDNVVTMLHTVIGYIVVYWLACSYIYTLGLLGYVLYPSRKPKVWISRLTNFEVYLYNKQIEICTVYGWNYSWLMYHYCSCYYLLGKKTKPTVKAFCTSVSIQLVSSTSTALQGTRQVLTLGIFYTTGESRSSIECMSVVWAFLWCLNHIIYEYNINFCKIFLLRPCIYY